MANHSGIAADTDGHYSEGFQIISIILLLCAALLGLLGNGLVIAVISRMKKLKSVMNRFILHLAVSDILVSALAIPLFVAINFFYDKNVEHRVWTCKTARFLQYLAPEASMALLITIGINRHRAIVHPLNMMTFSTANKLIIAAWIYAIAVVAPSIPLTEETYYFDSSDNVTKPYCATIPVSTVQGRIYVLFLSVCGYVLPLTTLIALYARICCVVWRRDKTIRTSRSMDAMLRTRKKVIKMFLTVIVVFAGTWIPLLLYVGMIEGYLYKSAKRVDEVRLVLYFIGLSNSVCNPFIYSFFNARFREGCKGIFKASIRAIKNPRESFKHRRNRRSFSPAAEILAEQVTDRASRALARKGGFRETTDSIGNQEEERSRQEYSQGNSQTRRAKSGTLCTDISNSIEIQEDSGRRVDSADVIIKITGAMKNETAPEILAESNENLTVPSQIQDGVGRKKGMKKNKLLKAFSLDYSSTRKPFEWKEHRKARSVSDERSLEIENYGLDTDDFENVF